MTTSAVLFVFAALVCVAITMVAADPPPPSGTDVNDSPTLETVSDIHDNIPQSCRRTVLVRMRYPGSSTVRGSLRGNSQHRSSGATNSFFLRGNQCGLSWDWSVQMLPMGNDWFGVSVNCSVTTSTTLPVELKVMRNDADWQIGSNVKAIVTCVSDTEASKSIDVYPWFDSNAGSVKVFPNIYSPQLDNHRSIVVYYPPSFAENRYKTYSNLLVMHDGDNLFSEVQCETCCAFGCWDVRTKTLDPLIIEGAIDEVILVGVYNTINRTSEYTYSVDPDYGGGDGNAYLDFLEENVLLWTRQTVPRLSMNSQTTVLAGSSLGGLISCYAGWTRPTVFRNVACMSSSFFWNNEDFNNVVLKDTSKKDLQNKFYLDSGDAGDSQDDMAQTVRVRDHFEQLGYSIDADLLYYLDHNGEHNEKYWGDRFWRPISWFFPVQSVKV